MKPDIAAFVVIPEHPTTFDGSLDMLAQAVQLLHGNPSSQDVSPINVTYHAGTQDILVASSRPSHALIQVETADVRRAYTFDAYATNPIVINEFLDSNSDEPSRSFALKPIPANVPTLVDLYDYVQRAADHRKDN